MEEICDRERMRNWIARKDLTCEMKPMVEALNENPRVPCNTTNKLCPPLEPTKV